MNKNVGQLLKELREKKHLSQNQLAEKLHISRSVIAKYETGEREPSFNNLIILSKYFKIPITDLIPIYENSIKSDNTKDVLNYLLKQNKSFRIIVLTLIVTLLITTVSAIVYINVLNYVSTKVYKVLALNSNTLIKDGLLVKTKDKIYLSFVTRLENKEATKLRVYYLNGKEKNYLVETSEINNLKFYADLNDEEYFDSDNYKCFFNNSYLEIYYKDDTTESFKLTYEFDYTNNNLDNNIEETIEKNSTDEKTESNEDAYAFGNYQKSELYDIVVPFMKDNNFETFNVKLDGINYEVSIINKILNISFKRSNQKYKISYLIHKNKETLKCEEISSVSSKMYSKNITDNICEGSKCYLYEKDIILIKKIIEKLKK